MPSSLSHVECVVKNEEQVEIGRSSASVADSENDDKQITCVAFGFPPIVPQGVCE